MSRQLSVVVQHTDEDQLAEDGGRACDVLFSLGIYKWYRFRPTWYLFQVRYSPCQLHVHKHYEAIDECVESENHYGQNRCGVAKCDNPHQYLNGMEKGKG